MPDNSERILTYSQAILEATELEMTANPKVVVFGIGVDDFKGTYGTTMGLHKKFGPGRWQARLRGPRRLECFCEPGCAETATRTYSATMRR